MSERKILIDGVEFVRARDAARRVGLVPDYVTRLARGELVAGKLVRGLWFISLASLRSFMTDQERQKEIWRAELAGRRREEQRLAGHPSTLAIQ